MKRRGELILFLFVIIFLSLVSGGELKVTDEHPFLLNGQWIEAKDLEVGDELFTIYGKRVRIDSIEEIVRDEKVYNLEAGKYHDFVVGEEKVIVHNSNLRRALVYGGISYALLTVPEEIKAEEDIDKIKITAEVEKQGSGLDPFLEGYYEKPSVLRVPQGFSFRDGEGAFSECLEQECLIDLKQLYLRQTEHSVTIERDFEDLDPDLTLEGDGMFDILGTLWQREQIRTPVQEAGTQLIVPPLKRKWSSFKTKFSSSKESNENNEKCEQSRIKSALSLLNPGRLYKGYNKITNPYLFGCNFEIDPVKTKVGVTRNIGQASYIGATYDLSKDCEGAETVTDCPLVLELNLKF